MRRGILRAGLFFPSAAADVAVAEITSKVAVPPASASDAFASAGSACPACRRCRVRERGSAGALLYPSSRICQNEADLGFLPRNAPATTIQAIATTTQAIATTIQAIATADEATEKSNEAIKKSVGALVHLIGAFENVIRASQISLACPSLERSLSR